MSKETITLYFSPQHAKKMVSGRGVSQLSHDYLTGKRGEALEVQVRRPVANRLRKAARAGKSARVRMDELEGQGIREFFAKLKDVGQKIKGGLEKFVKPIAGPMIKEAVGRLADVAESKVAPFLPEPARRAISENKGKAVDWLGQQTGAYGVMGYPVYGGAVPMMGVYYPQPMANWSVQAMPLAPAMMSKLPWPGYGMNAGVPGGEPFEGKTGGQGFRVI